MAEGYLSIAGAIIKTVVEITKLIINHVDNQKKKNLIAEMNEATLLLAKEREKALSANQVANNDYEEFLKKICDLQQLMEMRNLTMLQVTQIQDETRQLQEAMAALDDDCGLWCDEEKKAAAFEKAKHIESINQGEANSFDSHFYLLGLLSEGVFSKVHLVQHKVSDNFFAAKLFPLYQDGDNRSIQRELAALNKLPSHQNVIEVIYYFENDARSNSHVLVFPYFERGTVNENILGGRLTEKMKKFVMHDILLGMAHIHRHNIIHLDLKPDNFLLDYNDCVKISDFGVAKALSRSQQAAASLYYYNNGELGTLQIAKYYIPPEIMTLNGNNAAQAITFKSDIYQAGCSFLAMMLETYVQWNNDKHLLAPYLKTARGRYLQLAEAQLEEHFDDRVKQIFAQFSDGFGEIIQSMMYLEPAQRPYAEELIQSIQQYIEY